MDPRVGWGEYEACRRPRTFADDAGNTIKGPGAFVRTVATLLLIVVAVMAVVGRFVWDRRRA